MLDVVRNEVLVVARNEMIADPTLSGLLKDEIHIADAPRATPYPLMIIQKISELRYVTSDGDTGLGTYLVQFDLYTKYHADLRRAGGTLRDFWSGRRSEKIQGAFVQSIRETTAEGFGEDEILYHYSMDVRIMMSDF